MSELERASPLLAFIESESFGLSPTALRADATRGVVFGATPFITDLGRLARSLICGGGAAAQLESAGLPTPALCTWAGYGRDGFVARLGPHEWLVSAGGATPLPASLPGSGNGVLALEHEIVEIALGGEDVPALLSELTATDLRQFGAGAFIPVLLAGNECWLRALPAPRPHYRVYCTPADASFMFGTLLELVREAGGALFGLEDFFSAHLTEEGQS